MGGNLGLHQVHHRIVGRVLGLEPFQLGNHGGLGIFLGFVDRATFHGSRRRFFFRGLAFGTVGRIFPWLAFGTPD